MREADALDRLARALGITPEYHDIWGELRRTSPETMRALLSAMGLRVDSTEEVQSALDAVEASRWTRVLEPVQVVREGEGAIEVPFCVAASSLDATLELELIREDATGHAQVVRPRERMTGESREIEGRTWWRCTISLEVAPGLGYHTLVLSGLGASQNEPASSRLIVTPARCWLPPSLADGRRAWGPALQLYALRSADDWGIGDLGVLSRFAASVSARGAGLVGLNPLHAAFPGDPWRASPYSPSTRLFLNEIYLDLESVPEFAASPEVRALSDGGAFRARLDELRARPLVDYAGVAQVKRQVLEVCHARFRQSEQASPGPAGRDFRAFVETAGEALASYARFEAARERFAGRSWHEWPETYRRPDAPAVAALDEAAAERVELHQWVQWHLDRQLAAAHAAARAHDDSIGLYRDLAVGVDPSGFDAWRGQAVYARGASYGAPPDAFAPEGQDWGLPPWIPSRLREARYEPFREVLRANMRHAGALRIDHVMGLMRAFWVPSGALPVEGAYVRYPFEDLLGIVALESQRHHCMVVGEDLGTVPDEVRGPLAAAGVFSYRPLYFMKDARGEWPRPDELPAQALVTVTTHDLPTLHGFWIGRDLTLREELAPEAAGSSPVDRWQERRNDRQRLLEALAREGLLPAGIDPRDVETPMTAELALASHRYLARTPSQLLTFQLEDVLGEVEQANLPGTTDEHPNWRRRLPLTLEQLAADERFTALMRALAEERGPHRG